MPLESATARSPMPASRIIFETAMPAAPAPETTTRRSARVRPVTLAALRSAASVTIAVPCWSSWNTGMSRRSCTRRSTSKQRGALMSSRLMPPNAGASRDDGLDQLVGVGDVEADRHGVDAAEVLEQHRLALHDREGGGGADVAEPEHRGAVGDDGDGARLPGVVVDEVGLLGDRRADPGDPGRVGDATGRRGSRAAR